MADEFDPRLEARLREVLRHEADVLPFTLTVADINAVRRARHSPATRLRVPIALLASAAAIVIAVVGLVTWRDATMPPTGTGPASPNPLSADLSSYTELASGITLVDGQVIARGEELVGAPASGEVMVGTIPANDTVETVLDCRGGRIEIMVRMGDTTGGHMATTCDSLSPLTAFVLGFETDGAGVWVKADPGTVWRLVVGGAPSAELPSYEELAAVALSTREVAQGEGQEGPTDETTEIMKLGDLWNLEIAVACTGPGGIEFRTTGTPGFQSTSTFDCSGGPVPGHIPLTVLDTAAERSPDAALVASVPAGTAWRTIVFDRSADVRPMPKAPAEPFPMTDVGGFTGLVLKDDNPSLSSTTRPIPAGATIEVAMGCTGDPSSLVRIVLDGVAADLACLEGNVWLMVPDGDGTSELQVSANGTVWVDIALRAFTGEQAGAAVAVPMATLVSESGTSKAQGFTTCLLSYAIPGGASADEGCGPTPYQVPDARAVRARAGESLWLSDGIDWTITGAAAMTYVPSSEAGSATPGQPAGHPAATRPGGADSLSIAPLPVGDWTLRMDVSGTLADGTTFTAQQLFRVIVEP